MNKSWRSKSNRLNHQITRPCGSCTWCTFSLFFRTRFVARLVGLAIICSTLINKLLPPVVFSFERNGYTFSLASAWNASNSSHYLSKHKVNRQMCNINFKSLLLAICQNYKLQLHWPFYQNRADALRSSFTQETQCLSVSIVQFNGQKWWAISHHVDWIFYWTW